MADILQARRTFGWFPDVGTDVTASFQDQVSARIRAANYFALFEVLRSAPNTKAAWEMAIAAGLDLSRLV